MPFAAVERPSFGLTQIQGYLKKRFADNVAVNIRYMNHEFAAYIGLDKYYTALDGTKIQTGLEMDSTTTGLKEWLFRHIVFPEYEDNQKEFFEYLSFVTKEVKEYAVYLKNSIEGWLTDMIQKWSLDQADVVALTCMFDQRMPSFALAKKTKQINPNVITVMGGPACEYPAARIIAKKMPSIDYVISGSGLIAFAELIDRLLISKLDHTEEICGVFTAQNASLLTKTKHCYGQELSINEELELDYGSFFNSLKQFPHHHLNPMLFFETSRGCWWGQKKRCLFCDINGRNTKYNVKDAEIAKKELKKLFKYKNECSIFWATDSVIPEELLDQVFPYVNEDMEGSKVFYEVRSDLSLTGIKKMASQHIQYVQAGIESLDDHVLDKINKGVNTETNLLFLRRCTQHGIHVLWNILTGIPGELIEFYNVYFELIPKLFHMPPPSGIWSFSYQRNSEYYHHQKEYGIELKPRLEPEIYLYPFEKNEISDLIYTFSPLDPSLIYNPSKMKKIYKIELLIKKWKNLWLNGTPPVLNIQGDILQDTRHGEKTISLNSVERSILNLLETPKMFCDICDELQVAPDVIKNAIDNLLREYQCLYYSKNTKKYLNLATYDQPLLKQPFIPESFHELTST